MKKNKNLTKNGYSKQTVMLNLFQHLGFKRFRNKFGMTSSHAFTLAEVLITLTIIGVIAALTIPNLMRSYNRHVYEVKTKQAYSFILNSIQAAMKEFRCDDIECLLSENGFNPNQTTGYSVDDQIKIAKIIFKDVETDSKTAASRKYGQWYIYKLNNAQISSESILSASRSYDAVIRINKKYGLIIEGFYNYGGKHPCSYDYNPGTYDPSCVSFLLYTDADKPSTKQVIHKNVFPLYIKGNGTPRLCRYSAGTYKKANVINPSGSVGWDVGLCYLYRNNWKMDYLK